MNIQQFKYILAVVDSKNYEDASDRCFVTQSTLSTMISRFEDEIDIKIFNRKTKPVSITKEGEPIIERLRIIINEIESLESVVQELKGEVAGDIKIGVIPTIAPYLLPLFLPKFASDFPKLNIKIKEITTENILEKIKKRTIDIGIVALPLEDKQIISKELYTEPFVIYDCIAENDKDKTSIDQIDNSKLWLLQDGHCMRTQVDKICKIYNKNKNAKFEFESASMASLLNFTKLNEGITIIPELALASMDLTDKKRITYFKSPTPARSIGLITHQFFAKKELQKQLEKYIVNATKELLENNTNFEIMTP